MNPRKADNANDVREIRTIVERWTKAVRERNLEGVLANHSADILMFDVPPPARLTGIDAYKQSWVRFFAWLGKAGIFDVSNLDVHAGDVVAFATGNIRCSGEEHDGRTTELDHVRLTVGLCKFDGRWTIVHEHHSVPAA